MKLFEVIQVALSSLRSNKLRSFLTMLGIIVGIFSIIAISTVISMLQNSIEEGVAQLANYAEYFTYSQNAAHAKDKYGLSVENPKLVLVVGSWENSSPEEVDVVPL
jgi:ABC-type antimicrobial peptide transport system permease subunit